MKTTKVNSLEDLRNLKEGEKIGIIRGTNPGEGYTEGVFYEKSSKGKYFFIVPSLSPTSIAQYSLKESELIINDGNIRPTTPPCALISSPIEQNKNPKGYQLAKQMLIDAGLWNFEGITNQKNKAPVNQYRKKTHQIKGPLHDGEKTKINLETFLKYFVP